MFFSILPISVMCLVLAYSGWVPPDVHLSSSTQLIPLRVSYSTEIYSTPPITSLVLFEDDNPSLTLGYCDITRPPDDMCGLEISENDEISAISQFDSEALMFGKNVRCPQLHLPPIDMVKMTKIEKTKSALIVYHDKNGVCHENYPDDTDSDEDLVCSREEVRLDGKTENHNLVILVIFLQLLLLQCKHGLLGRLYSSFGMGFSLTSKNTKKLKDLDIELELENTEFAEKIKFFKNQIDDKYRNLAQKEVDLTTVRAQLIDFVKTAPVDVVVQLNKNLRRNIDSGLTFKRMRPSWQDKIDIHGILMGNGYGRRRRPRRA